MYLKEDRVWWEDSEPTTILQYMEGCDATTNYKLLSLATRILYSITWQLYIASCNSKPNFCEQKCFTWNAVILKLTTIVATMNLVLNHFLHAFIFNTSVNCWPEVSKKCEIYICRLWWITKLPINFIIKQNTRSKYIHNFNHF